MAVVNDYLNCKSYLGHQIVAGEYDTSVFFDEKTAKHYFAILLNDKEVYLKSEGYVTAKSRDNGLTSVFKNINLEGKKQIAGSGKKNYFILKAGNNQEIARSCDFDTKEIAEKTMNSLAIGESKSASKIKTAKAIAIAKQVTKESATTKTKSAVKVIEKAAEVLVKNKTTKTPTKTSKNISSSDNGTSGTKISENFLVSLKDYLDTNSYLDKDRIWDSYGITGFAKFIGEDSKFYFAVYNPDATLYLKSAGYTKESDLDDAFDLMESSILLEENYKVELFEGKYYVVLFEYNEILAISDAFNTFIDAFVTTPGGRPKEIVGTMY